jgi:hypothetical protein
LNRQITELAPVLNSPSITETVTIHSGNPDVPIAAMMKRHAGITYLFAVALRPGKTRAQFTIAAQPAPATSPVTVLGENRQLAVEDGGFADHFQAWDVHLYKWSSSPRSPPSRREKTVGERLP